jgi:hypothetical protein
MSAELAARLHRGRLLAGEVVSVGRKHYVLCRACRAVVRVDKPLVGSTHLCG